MNLCELKRGVGDEARDATDIELEPLVKESAEGSE